MIKRIDDVSDSRQEMNSLEGLRRFFGACDAREVGHEPDWHEHERVIQLSCTRDGSGT